MEILKERPANANQTATASEIGVCVAGSVLVIASVTLRYMGRLILQKRMNDGVGKRGEKIWGLDDLFNVLAFASFFGLVTAVLIATHRGMGVHLEVILYERGKEGFTSYNQAIYVSAILYNFCLGMIKLSVLSLYQRILRGVQSQMLRTIVWVVFGIIAANTTANVLVATFQCRPVKAAWDISIPPADKQCVNINAFYIGNAITGVATDAIVYFLSIPIVLPLQLDKKTKLQLLATMLVGGFAVVTSAVRLGFIPALMKTNDPSYAMSVPMNWSIAEPAIGILVSSMPAIRALRYFWRKPGDDSYGSGIGNAQSSLRSRDGQIKLEEVRTRSATDAESAKTGGSEEGLVEERKGRGKGQGMISRTREIEISYEAAD